MCCLCDLYSREGKQPRSPSDYWRRLSTERWWMAVLFMDHFTLSNSVPSYLRFPAGTLIVKVAVAHKVKKLILCVILVCLQIAFGSCREVEQRVIFRNPLQPQEVLLPKWQSRLFVFGITLTNHFHFRVFLIFICDKFWQIKLVCEAIVTLSGSESHYTNSVNACLWRSEYCYKNTNTLPLKLNN